MDNTPIVVYVTVPTAEVGKEIANLLLEKKLAACVNILPAMTSIYIWEDAIHEDEEQLLIIKTRSGLFESHLVPAVKSVHPYDVPEILALPVWNGSRDYLDWIKQVIMPRYPQA